jgi:hypothetical protein
MKSVKTSFFMMTSLEFDCSLHLGSIAQMGDLPYKTETVSITNRCQFDAWMTKEVCAPVTR